jgi:hypothetical protein
MLECVNVIKKHFRIQVFWHLRVSASFGIYEFQHLFCNIPCFTVKNAHFC